MVTPRAVRVSTDRRVNGAEYRVVWPSLSTDELIVSSLVHLTRRRITSSVVELSALVSFHYASIAFGMSLPHRSPDAIDMQDVRISKRIFMAVDERPERARAELHRWFTEVYRNPAGTDASGIHGTQAQVREKLEAVIAMGANHLLLNPVSRYAEQVEAMAEVVGLR